MGLIWQMPAQAAISCEGFEPNALKQAAVGVSRLFFLGGTEVRAIRFPYFRHAGLVPASMFPQGVQALLLRLDGPRNKSGVTLDNATNSRFG